MAQELLCLCADLLQQQSAEVRILLAHAHRIRLVLFHIQ